MFWHINHFLSVQKRVLFQKVLTNILTNAKYLHLTVIENFVEKPLF